MAKVNWAIIGIGTAGRKHLATITSVNKCTLKAICDIDESKLRAPRISGATRYLDVDEMLRKESLDVVSICTPHDTHYPIASSVLKHGIDVLIEKPPTMTTSDGRKLVSIAARNEAKAYVAAQYRYSPIIRRLKALTESRRLGTPVVCRILVNWPRSRRYYFSSKWKGRMRREGGLLFNQFFHHIDVLSFVFGIPTRVEGLKSKVKYRFLETEDTILTSMAFEGGLVATFSGSVVGSPNPIECLELVSTSHYVRAFGTRFSKVEIEPRQATAVGFRQDLTRNFEEKLYYEMFTNIMDHRNGQAGFAVTLSDVIPSVGLINRIYKNCAAV